MLLTFISLNDKNIPHYSENTRKNTVPYHVQLVKPSSHPHTHTEGFGS